MPNPTSALDLEAIRSRVNAATPGKWVSGGGYIRSDNERFAHGRTIASVRIYSLQDSETDAAFIAAARQDVPALLAEIERLRAIEERLQSEIIGLGDAWLQGSNASVKSILEGIRDGFEENE